MKIAVATLGNFHANPFGPELQVKQMLDGQNYLNTISEGEEMSNKQGILRNRKKALYLLRSSINSFNQLHEKNPSLYFNLSGMDLSGMNLTGVNFSSFKCVKTNFTNCILNNAIFCKTNLNEAILENAQCLDCDFSHSRLEQTNFSNANINGAIFYSALMTDTVFSNVKCDHAYIQKQKDNKTNVEYFEENEFETIYGNKMLKVVFNDGMKPIDLIALPYYVDKILTKYSDQKIVFEGLSVLSEKCLIFRIEPRYNNIQFEIQKYFNDIQDIIKIGIQDCKDEIISIKSDINNRESILEKSNAQIIRLAGLICDNNNNYPKLIQNVYTNNMYYLNEVNCSNVFQNDVLGKKKEQLYKEIGELKTIYQGNSQMVDSIKMLETAINEESESKFILFLKNAGKKTLDISLELCKDVLSSVLKSCIGLP